MKQTRQRVLIVDDEPSHLSSLCAILESCGYVTTAASDSLAAVDAAVSQAPALILINIRPSWRKGFDTCRLIREFTFAPIIMLTALSEQEGIVGGLAAGADICMTRPFNTDELLARVQAVLRRMDYKEL